MSPSATVIALGVVILVLGIIGYLRTKSPTAIGFNGAFSIVCIILGLLLAQGRTGLLTVTQIWVGLIALASMVMGARRLMAPNRATAPIVIFTVMAVLSVLTLVVLFGGGTAAP